MFLDRDGTIIRDCHYLRDPARVVLEDGVVEGLLHLQKLRFVLVIVSNQSGIGRGFLTNDDVKKVNNRLEEILSAEGVHILAWFICPHTPKEACDCRKPRSGLIEQAVREQNLDLSKSIIIGDKASDMELAQACNLTGYLVRTGHGHEYSEWAEVAGFSTFGNLYEAAISIAGKVR